MNAHLDGELLVRTGIEVGPVRVEVRALDQEPADVEPGWEDVADMSFRAGVDARVAVLGQHSPAEENREDWVQRLDAHGEGWYRIRVHATGRDLETGDWAEEPVEEYLVMSWPAPRAEPLVHRANSEFARFALDLDRAGEGRR